VKRPCCPPCMALLFAARHLANHCSSQTRPIPTAPVYTGQGRGEAPVSKEYFALGCNASQASWIAAGRGPTRSAKGNPTFWSVDCGLHVAGASQRWLVRTDALSRRNLADGPLFGQSTRHLAIMTRRESADERVLLLEKT
jgi:hypothetical protein